MGFDLYSVRNVGILKCVSHHVLHVGDMVRYMGSPWLPFVSCGSIYKCGSILAKKIN